MKSIKIKYESVPYYEGLALYVNGHKVHIGVFVNLEKLREFWHTYRVLLCAGYTFEKGKCEKIN